MLKCARCGSSSIVPDTEMLPGVPGWHRYEKCLMCGCREFVEIENPATIIRTELVERVKQEAKVAKSGICKYEGCNKSRLAGGYCYRHYKEVNGHPYKGGQKNHKGGNIRMTTEQKVIPAASATQADPIVWMEQAKQFEDHIDPNGLNIILFRIFLDPELLEKLTARAKAEYRTAEQQAAYILHKELSA
jgi:predicted nucleic-acid-binding Zn-ribbon protein